MTWKSKWHRSQQQQHKRAEYLNLPTSRVHMKTTSTRLQFQLACDTPIDAQQSDAHDDDIRSVQAVFIRQLHA